MKKIPEISLVSLAPPIKRVDIPAIYGKIKNVVGNIFRHILKGNFGMPANVETMFSVEKTPWHGLGVVINHAPTIKEGIEFAGLNWAVEVRSLTREDGVKLDEFGKAFVRSDNKKTLGIVGPKTHPLQNADAFNFFQGFVDAKEATLETAGSLDEGRKVWVMAKISRPNSIIVPGDEVAKFVLLSNAHDGTTAVRVGFTPIRVVCANTLALAHTDKASKLIRVRHSKDVTKNVEALRETMNLADEEFEATAEQFRFLASRQINASDLRKYIKVVFKMDENDEKCTTRSLNVLREIMNKHENKTFMIAAEKLNMEEKEKRLLEKVTENFEAGRGTENFKSRGSFWTAYNAVNEYLNYERGYSDDTRMNSLWFGANAVANKHALDSALEMANAS